MSGHPILPRRPDHAAAAAAARRGGVSAHGHPAVRGPPEVHQGARSGDGSRPPDHAGGAEGRRQGRAQARRHVRGRLRVQHPADAEAARRHREGAGRRHAARQHHSRSPTTASTSSPRSMPVPPSTDATPEIEALRRAVTQQFDQYVKLNKKIPPEILTSHRRHRRSGPPGRHHRRAPAAQARGQAVGARPVRGAPSGWRSCSSCSSTRSTSCRWKSASAAASSARWRRASASTT